MKLVAVLLVLVIFAGIGFSTYLLLTGGITAYFSNLFKRREDERAMWRVTPRSLEDGTRQLWLTHPSEPDYLFKELRPGTGNDAEWDGMVMEAEIERDTFNRLRNTNALGR